MSASSVNETSPQPVLPLAPAISGSQPRADRIFTEAADETTTSGAQMRIVLAVSRMLAVPTELDFLLQRIAEVCTELLSCERGSIFLHDPATGELWTKVALKSLEIRVPCTAGIVGHAFTHNEVVHVADPYQDARFNPEPDRRNGFVTRNLLTCPMENLDGKPLGAIQAVNKTDGAFSSNDLALIQLLADQAGIAIQRHRLQLANMEALAMRHEMDLARRAQQELIPKSAPDVEGIDAVGWTMPASTTGGDCFDLWRTRDGHLGILLADASGHGLAPALIVTQTRTLVRALSDLECDPHTVLNRVNDRLCEDLNWGQFVTAFVAFLSPDGDLRWSSAGHGPVFIRPGPNAPFEVLEPPVQPLGVVPSWLDDAPPPTRLEPGGLLLLVSDGIFEAVNVNNEMYGVDRMMQLIVAQGDARPAELLAALRDSVRDWSGERDPLDDQTIVIVNHELDVLAQG